MPRAEQVLPKYLQIANAVRDKILDGTLKAGDEVASERALALDWRVARPTAARALGELRRLGLVESQRGAGTFVRPRAVAHRADERYQRSQAQGAVYGPDEYARILSAEIVDAPSAVRTALQLGEEAKAIRRYRVTLEGEHPNEASVSWFDAGLANSAPRLLVTERILEGTTAYVEQVTGRPATMAEDRICARRASVEEAEALGLRRGSAVLVTEHLVLDGDGLPLEWAESFAPPDRWTPPRRYRLRP
jgi:GntR family transcriptional regulator